MDQSSCDKWRFTIGYLVDCVIFDPMKAPDHNGNGELKVCLAPAGFETETSLLLLQRFANPPWAYDLTYVQPKI